MSTSTDTEALNARSNINSPEIDGCTALEEKLVDVQAEMKSQKNAFTKVVKSCQEQSRKCVKELDESREKLKNAEECRLELEKKDKVIKDKEIEINKLTEEYKGKLEEQDEAIRDKDSKIESLEKSIEECESTHPNNQIGDIASRAITEDDVKPDKCGYHAGYYKGSPENQIVSTGFIHMIY